MAYSETALDVIKRVVQSHLAPAVVKSVAVSEDVDHDGDDILRVEVVIEVEGDRLDPERVVGLVRHLREPLQNIHEERFPVFTFLKPDDVDGAAA